MTGANGVNPEGVRLAGKSKGWPHWTTPKEVLEVVGELGRVGLDPCSNEHSQVDPITECMAGGLELDWVVANGLLTFVNPPYNQAKAFVDKCVVEGAKGIEIVLLVAARTDTKWAHSIFASARMVCFWGPGRIRFGNPPPESDGDAPSIPSMFAYWGNRPGRFMDAFGKHGVCFDLRAATHRHTFPVAVRP